MLAAININTFKNIFPQYKTKPKPAEFVELLQANNEKTIDVIWNGSELTPKQLEENVEWVKSLNVKTINHGYFCSTCDPYLLLVAQIFRLNIIHTYLNHAINYTYTGANHNGTVKVASNRGHFWFVQ